MAQLGLRSGSWAGGARGGRSSRNSLFSLRKTLFFRWPGSSREVPEGRAGRPPERLVARPGGRRAQLGRFGELGSASGELRGRFLELWRAHFDARGTTLGDLGADFFPNRYTGGGFSLDPGVPGGEPGCNLQTPRPAPSPTLALRAPKFQIRAMARFSAAVAFRSTRSTSRCPSESSDAAFF